MKIQSPFRDYYDGCQMYGVDDDLFYRRKTRQETISFDEHPELTKAVVPSGSIFWPNRFEDRRMPVKLRKCCTLRSLNIDIEPTVIVIGDKILLKMDAIKNKYGYPGYGEEKTNSAYTVESLYTAISLLDKHAALAAERFMSETVYMPQRARRTVIQDYYDRVVSQKSLSAIRALYKEPVLSIEFPGSWMNVNVNPRLASTQIPKHVPAYDAWQLIVTYLANQKNPEPEMAEVGDEDRIRQHGFDDWSFRRHKSQSKKPRKRGKRREAVA